MKENTNVESQMAKSFLPKSALQGSIHPKDLHDQITKKLGVEIGKEFFNYITKKFPPPHKKEIVQFLRNANSFTATLIADALENNA